MDHDVRTMTEADLGIALGWARQQGWNPGLDDAAVFLGTDPEGFLLGSVEGEPVSSIALVRYAAGFAFLGLHLVAPAHRGRGLGLDLWRRALDTLPSTYVVGINGVPAQEATYRRSGFVLAHRTARWGGRIRGVPPPSPAVRDLTPEDLPAVAAYDLGLFLAARPKFLEPWVTGTATRRSVGYFDGDELVGYGTVRQCHDGWRVGPLFADGPGIAESLVSALVGPVAPGPVFLDVPEPNVHALTMARRLGLAPVFATARMFRGPVLDQPLRRIFAITTLELG